MKCYFCKASPNKYSEVPCCTGRFIEVNDSTRSVFKGKRLTPRKRPLKPMTKDERSLTIAAMRKDIIERASLGTLTPEDFEYAEKIGLALESK